MSKQTVTALYASRQQAEAAKRRLEEAGLGQDVDIHDQTGSERSGAHGEGGFMEKLKEFFGGHEDSHAYGEGIRRGNFLLTVRVEELSAERAAELLDATDALDLDRSQESWRSQGWVGPAAAPGQQDVSLRATESRDAALEATVPGAEGASLSGQTPPRTNVGASRQEEVVPLVEERLRVGKREVGRGGVRVRVYTVETPVHEQVQLREEHVTMERRPVDRPAEAGQAAFQDREVELTETAEEAVVAKDAVVREELVLRKDVEERTEQVDDTVRRTEVDVDDTTRNASGRTPGQGPAGSGTAPPR